MHYIANTGANESSMTVVAQCSCSMNQDKLYHWKVWEVKLYKGLHRAIIDFIRALMNYINPYENCIFFAQWSVKPMIAGLKKMQTL